MPEAFRLEAVRLLEQLLLDHEEKRPVDGELEPAVWLARVQEQLGLAAMSVDQADLAAVKLAGVACEAIGALAQFDDRPAAAAKRAVLGALDQAVEEMIADDNGAKSRQTPEGWVVGTVALLGIPAAAVGHLDDLDRDLPDPRDSGSITLEGDDPQEVLETGLLMVTVHATAALHYLYI